MWGVTLQFVESNEKNIASRVRSWNVTAIKKF
jgi:hypothetical protein